MCERQYDMAAVAALQQAAANVEAERRRLYRQELEEELLAWLKSQIRPGHEDDNAYDAGYYEGWNRAIFACWDKLWELSPTVTCDNPAN